MSKSYLPSRQAQFLVWLASFATHLSNLGEALGFSAAERSAVEDGFQDYRTAQENFEAAREAMRTARSERDLKRKAVEALVRKAVDRLQALPEMTDPQRETFGITVPAARTPVPPPQTAPLPRVALSQRLRHVVQLVDSQTPSRRARPRGVEGFELWVKIGGEPPCDSSEMKLLAVPRATEYAAEFGGADAGKNAYYMTRWFNRRGQTGPWSETLSATIAA